MSLDYASWGFGPLKIDVTILENHPDYRIWSVRFWKAGSPDREREALFHMEKGFWFGPVAYGVLAFKVAWDLFHIFYGGKLRFEGDSPRPLDFELYVETLKEFSESFDPKKDVPGVGLAINDRILEVPEYGEEATSLHNALLLFSEHGIPDAVEIKPAPNHTAYVVATWDPANWKPFPGNSGRKFTFLGLQIGPMVVSVSSMGRFFSMIGYYKSEKELRDLKYALSNIPRRRGPKEWSPLKMEFMLQRGIDYGAEDLQPGDRDL